MIFIFTFFILSQMREKQNVNQYEKESVPISCAARKFVIYSLEKNEN